MVVLKVKASQELGSWADMTTICKKELDLTAFVEAHSVKEDLSMSMPFTAKSGYGAAIAGCPKLTSSITAQMLGSKVIINHLTPHQRLLLTAGDCGDVSPFVDLDKSGQVLALLAETLGYA